MPYIKQHRRDNIVEKILVFENTGAEYEIKKININEIEDCGELNYAISTIILEYFKKCKNYQSINDISGACTEALAEFRRRVVGSYEDKKIKENGDLDF